MKNPTTKRLIQLQRARTLRAFADELGIGQSTLHNYLNGRRLPEDVIRTICKKTGCSADWLLGLKEGKVGDAETKAAAYKMHLQAQINETQDLLERMEG